MTLPKSKRLCGRRERNGTTLASASTWVSLSLTASMLSQGLVWRRSSISWSRPGWRRVSHEPGESYMMPWTISLLTWLVLQINFKQSYQSYISLTGIVYAVQHNNVPSDYYYMYDTFSFIDCSRDRTVISSCLRLRVSVSPTQRAHSWIMLSYVRSRAGAAGVQVRFFHVKF